MTSFLSDEQRLVLEKALGDKRRDDELNASKEDGKEKKAHGGGGKGGKDGKSKPSVLDIDPWESGGLMFLRRPSCEGANSERRGSHHEDSTLTGKQNLHLYNNTTTNKKDGQPDSNGFVPVSYSQSSHANNKNHNNSSSHHSRKTKTSVRSKGFWKGLVATPGDSKHYLDEKDPNYDPDEAAGYYEYRVGGSDAGSGGAGDQEEGGKNDEQRFKSRVVEDLQEYLSSGDMVDFKVSVEELQQPEMHFLLVKRAVLLALGRSQREREMVSQLFSFLYPKVLNANQMLEGFEHILDCVDDILVDHPQAVDMLSLFIARAVIDDILPPSFVQKVKAKKRADASLDIDLMANMERVFVGIECNLSDRHATERLLRCWGSGAGRDIDATKSSMHGLLNEYIMSEDMEEARHCLGGLKVPFFHHECVKQAIVMMLEEPKIQKKLMSLLTNLSRTGLVSDNQMGTGFFRVKQRLPDLELDIPQAATKFADLSQEASSLGLQTEVHTQVENGNGHHTAPASAADDSAQDKLGDKSFLQFRELASSLLSEYFSSGDTAEAVATLKEIDESKHHPWFVKRVLTSAMDRRPRHKEMVCVLLSEMYNEILKREDIEEGYNLLFMSMEDLILDVPDVITQSALFLARNIVDDLVKPSFIEAAIRQSDPQSAALETLTYAAQLLAARHAAERLLRCWGAGATTTADGIKQAMKKILEEFLFSEDIAEASKCLRDLSATYFHHEVVKLALIMSLEKVASEDQLMGLLEKLSHTGLLSENQIQTGFQRVISKMDDLVLDYPGAKKKISECAEKAQAAGWLVSIPEFI
jgi:hypothetical protein